MKLNLDEAAKLFGVTKQAIQVAIRKGSIPAAKNGPEKRRVYVEKKDVAHYRNHRWERFHHFEPDELSPNMAADVIGCCVQRVYHLLRINKLPFFRKGRQIITIKYEDALKLKDSETARVKKKMEKKAKKKSIRQILTRRIERKTNKPN